MAVLIKVHKCIIVYIFCIMKNNCTFHMNICTFLIRFYHYGDHKNDIITIINTAIVF